MKKTHKSIGYYFWGAMLICCAIGVITGHYWHLGTCCLSYMMMLTNEEDDDEESK